MEECSSDSDCYPGSLCCSNGCGHTCQRSYTPGTLSVIVFTMICCKILPGDVRRIIVAFTDDKVQVNRIPSYYPKCSLVVSKDREIHLYLNPFEIARAIQLCLCDLACLIMFDYLQTLTDSQQNNS